MRSGTKTLPGAAIIATHEGQIISTSTDEDGHYSLPDLVPGVWTIEVQLFGFTPAKAEVTVGPQPVERDWILELKPRVARRMPPSRPGGFQNVTLAQSANQAELANLVNSNPDAAAGGQSEAGDSFLVSGSVSRGLQESSQEEVFARARMEQMRPGGDSADGGTPPGFGGAGPGAGGPGGGGFGGGRGGGGFGGGPGGGGFGGGPGGGRGGFSGGGPGGERRAGRSEDRARRTDWSARNGTIGNRVNRGRNQLRGMAFLSLRDSSLDARPFSLTGQNSEKASYSQTRYGLMMGGPLHIPKLLKGDKTFFFLTLNGARASNPYDGLATVPTELERSGDFSQSRTTAPVQIFDPLTRQPFANNKIPGSRLDATALGLLQFMPLPNQPGSIQNYRFVTSIPQNTLNVGARLNQTLTRKDRLDVNYNLQRRDGTTVQLFGFEDTSNGNGFSSSLGWTHTFAPRVFNNVRWAISRNRSQVIPFFAFGENIAAKLGIEGTSTDPTNYGPPNLTFTNFGALTDASATLRRDQTSAVTDGVTVVKGPHSVTFGGEFRRVQLNVKTDQNARGTLSFSGLSTSGFDAQGEPLPFTGFDFADFLLSSPQSSSIRYGSSSNYFRGTVYNAFVSDDWKARANLTINAGLRYEFFTPLTEKYNRLANLDVAQGFSGVAVVTPDQSGPYTGGFPNALINPDKNNFSPRIGIAWKPNAKKPLLVRAGYGVY
ncbi:MAG TPA: TonB-dependent receptor, partial [Bryobacteraceae bacterium]|nr:TonB-dependent receptor [Bryobacteraceae bacterium]